MEYFGVMPDQKLRLIETSDEVDEKLAELFERDVHEYQQLDAVDFFPDYTPVRGTERLKLSDFNLPESMHREAARWHSRDKLEPEMIRLRGVKAVVAVETVMQVAEDGSRERRIVRAAFKRIDKSRIIDKSILRIVWNKDTFDRIDGPGISLPEGLDALFENGTLYFNSYQTANGFLDLTDWFDEASGPQIDDIMNESILTFDGEGTIHEFVNTTCKRSMSMLWRSGRLRDIEVVDVLSHASIYNIGLSTVGNGSEVRILVPETNKEFKQLLDLLNQNYFPGIFDGETYVANSKRPAT